MIDHHSQKIVVACTGASGMVYTKLLLLKLNEILQVKQIGLVYSKHAQSIWQSETGLAPLSSSGKITVYDDADFNAPFASGSSSYTAMVVCPSSMGVLGRAANGISDCLISRAADVMLKECRKLILVPRETPYNLIHIRNMEKLCQAGAIICPATPSFYSNPTTIEELALTVVDRIIDLLNLPNDTFRWGGF